MWVTLGISLFTILCAISLTPALAVVYDEQAPETRGSGSPQLPHLNAVVHQAQQIKAQSGTPTTLPLRQATPPKPVVPQPNVSQDPLDLPTPPLDFLQRLGLTNDNNMIF